MKYLFFFLFAGLFACEQKTTKQSATQLATQADPHTLSQPELAIVKHLDLALTADFSKKQLTGKATWAFENVTGSDRIMFDTKGLDVTKVTLGAEEKAATFTYSEEDTILGKALQVSIEPSTKLVNIYYSTSPNAGALQWLDPQQTAGKQKPFLLTQSEPILARSWIPCQDGPGIRFTYNATITAPAGLMAVMSAENPQVKSKDGIYHFKQDKPIPSYLLALAIGDLAFQSIDSRTGIYAEPATLKKAVYEFADMGKMVQTAEKLYGPYRWGRYNVLVLPPSFPYGGMENPNLTFLTPTVIAGDRSLVSVIAHELAHSWSGNLVTNASWNDMWLNEGFTTYFERRIVEEIYDVNEAKMQEVLGRQSLNAEVTEKGPTSRDTKLKGEFAGRDPDAGISDIEYEKGYAFIRTIEEAVGRSRLDSFLKNYFNKNAFHSQTTEQFAETLKTDLVKNDTALANNLQIQEWLYQPGIPSNIAPAVSPDFKRIDSLLAGFKTTDPATFAKEIRSTNQQLYFITHLPVDISLKQLTDLDKAFKFTSSGNAEVQTAWYTVAIRNEYQPAYPAIETFLTHVGRRKFLVPLYKELIKTDQGKDWAKKIYSKARPNYHPVSYNTIDAMLKS